MVKVVKHVGLSEEDWVWVFSIATGLSFRKFFRYTQADSVLFSIEELQSLSLEVATRKSASSEAFLNYILTRNKPAVVKSMLNEAMHQCRSIAKSVHNDEYIEIYRDFKCILEEHGLYGIPENLSNVLTQVEVMAVEEVGVIGKASKPRNFYRAIERLAVEELLIRLARSNYSRVEAV